MSPTTRSSGAAKPSVWPVDGSTLDRLDKSVSGPFFRLRLPLPIEFLFSIPGCFFGMPTFHMCAPSIIACSLGGCSRASPEWLAVLAAVMFLLLAAWAYVQSSPARAHLQPALHAPPALLLSPVVGVALATRVAAEDVHAQSAAFLFLIVWYLSIVPVITFKARAGRRRPVASDVSLIGAEAAAAAARKALPNIPAMHKAGDANSAFPSGDVAGAVAFAYPLLRCAPSASLAPAAPWLLPASACACVTLSAAGRMYYQAHHLLDVACGALFAALAGALFEYTITGTLGTADVCAVERRWWEPFAALAFLAAYAKATKSHKAAPTYKGD
jgi:membrane-associated phospholipid phosphatase